MIPLFSATNTWPAGVTSTSMGVLSPVIGVDSAKPAGSVAAPAAPAAISAETHARTMQKATRTRVVLDIWPSLARRSGEVVANPKQAGGSLRSQRKRTARIAPRNLLALYPPAAWRSVRRRDVAHQRQELLYA